MTQIRKRTWGRAAQKAKPLPSTLQDLEDAVDFARLPDGLRTRSACEALASEADPDFDLDGFFCQGHVLPGTLEALPFLAALVGRARGPRRAAAVFVLSYALELGGAAARKKLWACRELLAKALAISVPSDADATDISSIVDERVTEADDEVVTELGEILVHVTRDDEHTCGLDPEDVCAAFDGDLRPHDEEDDEDDEDEEEDDAEEGEPARLDLAAYTVLLDELAAQAPTLDVDTVEARLRRLDLLGPLLPAPLIDGPRVVTQLCATLLAQPHLARLRPALARNLRATYAPIAYAALLASHARGEIKALDAIAAVPRLGYEQACAVVSRSAIERLVRFAIEELAGPAQPFEESAVEHGGLPGSASSLPAPICRALAIAFLDSPRFPRSTCGAVDALLALGPQGAHEVLVRANRLTADFVQRACAALPYPEARQALAAALGEDVSTHPALMAHPDAPPDLTLVDTALRLLATEPARAFATLVKAARDLRSPLRGRALGELMRLAGPTEAPSVRKRALHALGTTGAVETTPMLLAALGDPALADAIPLVLTALTDVSDERALPALKQLLDGPHSAFAQAAIAKLTRRSEPRPFDEW
jgi:hypothetical protein